MMKTMTNKKYHETFATEWDQWRTMHQSLSETTQHVVRRGAIHELSQFAGPDQGISSSDGHHAMFSIWKRNSKDRHAYVTECTQLALESVGI